MARKKTETVNSKTVTDQIEVMKSVTQSLMKEFKDTDTVHVYDGTSDLINISDFVKTNITLLDGILGKGFPCGRVCEVYGEPSAGKTAIATYAMIDVINRGGLAVYLDTEAAYSFELAEKSGLDRTKMLYMTPKTLEDIYRSIEKIVDHVNTVNRNHLVIIVVDSIAATPSHNELENDIGKAEMGERAKINSKGLRKVTQMISDNKICLLLVNQTRTKFVMFGDPEFVPGGAAIDFHTSIKLKVRKGKNIEDSSKTVIGQKMILKTTKNKVFNPQQHSEIELYFEYGIPKYSGVYEWLSSNNLIRKYGESFYFKEKGKEKEDKYPNTDFVKFVESHSFLLDKKNWKDYLPEKLDN